MGQKINPIGLRLGINRGWDSTWFAKKKDFGKYLIEDFKMRNYIKKNITNSGARGSGAVAGRPQPAGGLQGGRQPPLPPDHNSKRN